MDSNEYTEMMAAMFATQMLCETYSRLKYESGQDAADTFLVNMEITARQALDSTGKD